MKKLLMLLSTLAICISSAVIVMAEEPYTIIAGGKSMSNAAEFSIGKDYATSLVGDETLYFKFTTPAQRGYLEIYLKNINIDTGNYWLGNVLTGNIVNDLGEVKCYIGVIEGDEGVNNVALEPNTTYYVKIFNQQPSDITGNLKFRVKYSQDKEGDDIADATDIKLDTKVLGSLDGDLDVDCFKFTTGKDKEYKFVAKDIDIECTHWSSNVAIRFQVINSVNEKIEWFGLSKEKYEEAIISLRPYTTYYIKVYNPDNKYSSEMGSYYVQISTIKKDITKALVSYKETYVYTGNSIEPPVTLVYGSNKLVKGKDYKISFSKNKNPGESTMKILGIGAYEGIIKKTFKIKPTKVSIKSIKNTKGKKVTIKWKAAIGISGYQIYVAKDEKFKVGKKSYKISAKETKYKISGLKKKKKYYFKIRAYKNVGKSKVYSSWSDYIVVKIKK